MSLVRIVTKVYLGNSKRAIATFNFDEMTIGRFPEIGAFVSKVVLEQASRALRR